MEVITPRCQSQTYEACIDRRGTTLIKQCEDCMQLALVTLVLPRINMGLCVFKSQYFN